MDYYGKTAKEVSGYVSKIVLYYFVVYSAQAIFFLRVVHFKVHSFSLHYSHCLLTVKLHGNGL